jgi:TatD DNase family protein
MKGLRSELFDTHVHLDAPPLVDDPGVIEAARRVGVGKFLVPGVSSDGWEGLLRLAGSNGIRVAPGMHPQFAHEWGEGAAARLRGLTGHPAVAAIGEIGLDALIDTPRGEQERAFRGQLRIAAEAGLPVLIHCRKATERLMEILRGEDAEQVGGIFHAFSGSLETALAAIRCGFAIGFCGTLTYPNARRAPSVLKGIPPEWIVLETDAPDLAPHPYRGKDNHPAYLPLIAAKVAEIRGWSREEAARITTDNAMRVLKIGNQ